MSKNPFDPFPELATERLQLRRLVPADTELLFSLRSDAEVNRYIQRDAPVNHDDVRKHMEKVNTGIDHGQAIYWVICLKENPELVGTICLWNFSDDRTAAELGYEMRPEFQGRGLMAEAMEAVLEYGFEGLNLETIEAFTHEHNEPSIHLLRKFGFVLQPERRDADVLANRIFVLEREAWFDW